jgi:protein disulfide-isomerase A1
VEMMRPVAQKLKQFLAFVTVDAKEYGIMAPILGLSADSFPSLAVENAARGQVFPFRGVEITPETVEEFVHSIAADKVKPWTPLPPPDVPMPEGDPTHDEL